MTKIDQKTNTCLHPEASAKGWRKACPPQNWRRVKLGDTLQLLIDHRGKTPKKLDGDWSLHGVPAISAKNIKNGQIVNEGDIRYVNQTLYDKWMPEKLEKGDILLTSEAPLGELLYLKEKTDYCLSQRLFALRTRPQTVYSRFLYYYLLSPTGRHQLLRRISGTAAEGIRQAELRQLDVIFPENLDNQKRIAGVLSSFDDKIELNNKISRTLEQMAQAVFSEKLKVKSEKLWETRRLGDIMQFEYGKALKAEERESGNVPVVGSSGIVGWHNKKLVSGPGIVVGRKGTVGNVIWIDDDFYPIDTTFYVVSELSLYFCFYVLKRQKFISGDSAVPGLNRNTALSHEIIVPPKEIIDKFEEQVKPSFQKMHGIKAENQKLAALRDLLLPKLMSGEIRI